MNGGLFWPSFWHSRTRFLLARCTHLVIGAILRQIVLKLIGLALIKLQFVEFDVNKSNFM